ncbi:prephenate dehydrogenase (NADP(+)) [Aspergillus tubingensis]
MGFTKESATIGIIGMGDMGKMYAQRLSAAGWRINACDKPDSYERLIKEFESTQNVTIFPNGHLVSRISDYIIYSVEAGVIDKVVEMYGPSTKVGAIVGGQTSCKAPELAAFDKHLPKDVEIVSCHSLHGPQVNPKGQPLVLIQHRASDESLNFVKEVLSCFESKFVFLSGEMHDRITADTQAVTHAAFLSMGTAWQANQQFPWEINRWVGGIENVKINITLRIYSNKWHVYAGLAILNPAAKKQIRQYAESVTDLYKLMIEGRRDELKRRVRAAGEAVFKAGTNGQDLLLKDEVLDRFSLSNREREQAPPNSHLSLLAIVDCWSKLGIVPYDHMICSTPLFRLWLGVTEYLFRNPELLEAALDTAVDDKTFRSDDLEFTFAARVSTNPVLASKKDPGRLCAVLFQSNGYGWEPNRSSNAHLFRFVQQQHH